MEKEKRLYYVDNKKFLQAMIDYRDKIDSCIDNEEERPVVPMYIAECIMKIATHLSYKPNFINYSFRDEMVSDGIENCLQYIDNFDPKKSDNPFAYFTQIIYYAFLRRIQKEKKYLYTKYKASENTNLFGETSETQRHDMNENYNDEIRHGEWSEEYMSEFIEEFEEKKRKKKKKKVVFEEV